MFGNKRQEQFILNAKKQKAEKEKKKAKNVSKTVAPLTNAAKINEKKKKYDVAQANNDFIGKRIANTEANKIREAAKMPLYSSAVGDKQALKTFSKTATAAKQNITNQMTQNTENQQRNTVFGQMFDKEENYIDKAKKGNLKGAALNFVGAPIQAAQSTYLNTLNNADSVISGKGLQPFQYNMDFTDYENASAERHGVNTITQNLSNINPKLGAAYNIGMNIATDPLNLLDGAAILKAKGLNTLGSKQYTADLLKGDKAFVPTAKGQMPKSNNVKKEVKPIPINKTSAPILPRNTFTNSAKVPPTLPKVNNATNNGKLKDAFTTAPIKDLGANANRFEERAMILSNSKQIQPKMLEKFSGTTSQLKRKFVDAGDTVAKISRINNDDGLYSLYNNARNSRRRAEYHIGEAQTDIVGKEIGKSLKSIFEPIRKKGDDYYEDFQEYMYHLHNVDRMAQGKPVFGASVTANESNLIAQSLLQKYPEFANQAQEIRSYLDNLMQYRVDAGLVSEDNAKIMAEMYKNYVPTYRANPKAKGINAFGNSASISKGIKKAKGSDKDLLPLHEQISKQTMQTIDAAHKNLFGMRLAENINPQTTQYIQEIKKIEEAFDVEADVLPELRNAFTVYDQGAAYQMKVDEGLYEGIKALAGKEPNELLDLATKGNAAFKELITSWNPMFLVRNFVRDLQDVGIYTKNTREFAKTYPAAVKEIATNGDIWKQYKALGGAGNSFFDYAKGYKTDSNWLKKNTLDRVEALNQGVEQAPRLTEFMSTINKLGHSPSYDELMQAMYNSADVTVNFGRSGTWGKTINSTFVPFFNPAIQGTSKLIRRFTETKGAKEWTELAMKITSLGVTPSLLNEMVYHDDPEYAQLQDNVKDTNYMFKLGNDEWLKIPKGRVLSLFGSTAQRVYRDSQGDKQPYAGLIKTGMQQSAPINPFESNIASPFILASNNQTWYGGEIEPQRVANMRPNQRYTESTTELSKKLVGAMGGVADKVNFSPMKLDYILDAYSGIVGDVAMPLMTPKAETNPFKKAFVVDSTTQNRISNDFYNAKQEITFNKNEETATLTDDVMNRYMSKVQGELSDRYEEIRKIQSGLGTDKYKREKARGKQQEINQVQLTALSKLKTIKETSDNLSSSYKDLDDLSREVNKEVFGSEYALKAYNKNTYEKAQEANAKGIDYDDFYSAYFAQKDYKKDIEKVAAIKSAIPNASSELLETFGISATTTEKADALSKYGIGIEEYQNAYESANTNNSGNVSKKEAIAYLESLDLPREKKFALMKTLVPALKDQNNPYN
jgi:hypothetical protein